MIASLRYSARDLRQLRQDDVKVFRRARKAIFSLGLWCHRRMRERRIDLIGGSAQPSPSIVTSPLQPSGIPKQCYTWSPILTSQSSTSKSNQHCRLPVRIEIETIQPSRLAAESTASGRSPLLDFIWSPSILTSQSSTPQSITVKLLSLYVLNAAALSKPHAVEHLAADLTSYSTDVAVITETHFKVKHSESVVGIDGYNLFRRDRDRRRGGGVALYVRSTIQSTVWNYSADDRTYEILWVFVGNSTFFGTLYHPPKPIYNPTALVDYIEACVEEINRDFPSAHIELVGDLYQQPDQDLVEQTGLTQIVHQPTRGANILDRIYVSDPSTFDTVRVVESVVRSDHKAIVAFSDRKPFTQPKNTIQCTFRSKSPTQNALFLQCLSNMAFESTQAPVSSNPIINTQEEFDSFYATATCLLNQFYPQRSITLTTRDPQFITPEIKAKLRRKNRLMRSGRIEEASALAARIGRDMKKIRQDPLPENWREIRCQGYVERSKAVDGQTSQCC